MNNNIENEKNRINIDETRREINISLDKNPKHSLELAEEVIKEYPGNRNVESMFNILRLECLIRLNRFEEVVDESKIFINKYIINSPKLACDFEFLKLRAIRGIAEKVNKKNGDKAVIEEIEKVISMYPKKQATKLERRRLRVLVSLGMTKKELNDEILKLAEKYKVSPATFRNQEDLYYKKESSDYTSTTGLNEKSKQDIKSKNNDKPKPKIDAHKFSNILELEDEQFDEFIKNLGQREKEYLLVARYKKQGRDSMATGAVKEYTKRFKEEHDSSFIKTLKTLANGKKGALDLVKWSKTASDLYLNLEPAIKEISDMEL